MARHLQKRSAYAFELDPLNRMISTWVGLRYYMARDYSRAIAQNRSSVELDPNFAAAHLLLGEDYLGGRGCKAKLLTS